MDKRDKGSAPQIGDRVPYVLVETKNLKSKVWEKAEDPEYAKLNGIRIDRLYYVEHQIVLPVTSILDFVDEVPEPLRIFDTYLNELRRQRAHNKDIRSMLSGGGTSRVASDAPLNRTSIEQPPRKIAKRANGTRNSSMNIKEMLLQLK